MKNIKYIFLGIIFMLIIGCIFFFIYKNNSKSSYEENTSTEYARTSAENNIDKNDTSNSENYNQIQNQTNETTTQAQKNEQPIEVDLSSFSTKIYSKDSNRQNNLQITASILNEKVIEPNTTFSFTQTIGKATPERGYKEADIYDKDGNKIKGYGGGNCQISSTLYNAVLELPSLNVIERHPHSKKVPYVKKDKDAAVAYGSVDFKFTNNYDFPIKIYCSVDSKNVSVRIVKINK